MSKTHDDLLARIVEICRPKFCGDTNILIKARVKIFGMTGEDQKLNGLIGTSSHPFSFDKPTAGKVGVYLDHGQIILPEGNRVNIPQETFASFFNKTK